MNNKTNIGHTNTHDLKKKMKIVENCRLFTLITILPSLENSDVAQLSSLKALTVFKIYIQKYRNV